MWQDILALFIVLIATLVVLRIFLPARLFRFGTRSGNIAPSSGGCGGCCEAGSACSKMPIKADPITFQRHG